MPNPLMAAVILAGGRSSRMGTSKALLSHHNGRLIDFIVATCQSLALEIYVSGQVAPFTCIPDRLPNLGPMGGILSAVFDLRARGIRAALFIPVDLPYLTAAALASLIESAHENDAVIYQDNPLPLYLSLNPLVCTQLEQFFLQPTQGFAVKRFLKTLSTVTLLATPEQSLALRNTNTPTEWQAFKEASLR